VWAITPSAAWSSRLISRSGDARHWTKAGARRMAALVSALGRMQTARFGLMPIGSENVTT